ncbi:tetratricopeptide repeat protein [Candidatus Poribacteria bacterium]|nr:tetratricopeptide repeat protein [Candidatus Poribacteria bacterium]
MSKLLKVFITYAHKDSEAKDELITRLAVLKHEGLISIWHDNEIVPGDKWREEIFSTHLPTSDILLYLVSAYSLASENCNKELGIALDEKITVIPIILEYCDWLNHQLSDFQALPDKALPLTKWVDKSEGWQSVIDGIRKGIHKIQSQNISPGISETEILAELACQRGNVLIMLGQISTAIETYSRAIELDPRHAFAYNNRGIAYDRKREVNKALKDYDEAIRLKKDFAEAYYNRGITYREKGEVDFAIKDFDKAIQLNPQFARAYSNRGNVYDMKNEIDRAIRDHNRAIELDLNNPIFYNNRGIAYGKKDEADLAIEDFNKAIELKPDYALAYNNRGAVYRSKGEYDKAIDDCDKAIQLKSDYAEPYSNRGSAYRNKGDYDRAIEDYHIAIKLKPSFVEAYYNRGLAYHEKGELDVAVKDYSKAIELNPKLFHPYYNRGNAYLQKRDFDRAIEDYSKAIELNPELGPAYCNRGEAWLHQKEWDKAKVDLTAAKDKGVDIIAAFHNGYRNVAMFERRNSVKLPKDIVAMLTRDPVNSLLTTQRLLTGESYSTMQTGDDKSTTRQTILPAEIKSRESFAVLELLEKFRRTGKPLSEYLHGQSSRGITTGCNEAFIVADATRDALIAEHPSSADVLKPFVMARDIQRWRVKPVDESRREPQDKWLIFTHRGIDINAYPAIKKHLEKYRDALEKRSGKQEWYELQTVPTDTTRFTQPKCIYADMASETAFAFDDEGYYVGSPASLLPTNELWLLGVLNTKAVSWFYARTAPQVRGPFLKFVPRYVSQIPIPDMESEQKALIHKIVEYILYLKQQPTVNSRDLKYARDRVMVGYFDRIIDGIVYEAYLSDELHKGDKHFFQPLLDEQLPRLEEIQGDKMSAFRDIFEHLHERTHPIRINLFFLDSIKPIRIIESKA